MLAVSVVLSHVSLQAAALSSSCYRGLTSVPPAHLDTPVPQGSPQLLRTAHYPACKHKSWCHCTSKRCILGQRCIHLGNLDHKQPHQQHARCWHAQPERSWEDP